MTQQHDVQYGTFREEVRDFIAQNLPEDMAARVKYGFHQLASDVRFWHRKLFEKGWSAPNWPVEYGGTGWSLTKQHIFEEEAFLAGAPQLFWNGLRLLGPVIQQFATAEQKQRFLPDILSGDTFWAQGFSEPNAGSDLASLRTKATLEGDNYVINGHKTWTSEGHHGQWMFALVRTNPQVKPQAGISLIVFDLDTPGIEMRPIISIDEGHNLNEVFLTNVAVPRDNLIGEEGMGWTYAKFLLSNERTFSAEVPRNKRMLLRLKDMASKAERNGRPIIMDAGFRLRLAELEVELIALEQSVHRLIAAEEAKESISLAAAAVLKVRGSELQQALLAMQLETLGKDGMRFYQEPTQPDDFTWSDGPDYAPGVAADFLYRRATTIYGGSNEIQRNIIARTVLGKVTP